jgi:hypothetical protein
MEDNGASRLQRGQRSDDQGAMEDEASDDDSTESRGGPLWRDSMVFDSPDRMMISDHERSQAINIKAAIATNPEVDPVSDFMCAQLALIEGDNLEGAMARVYQLQCFREEYRILDTAEDGRKCFDDVVNLFPKVHLCLTYFDHDASYVMVYDNTQFDASQLRSEENLRSWLGCMYYSSTLVCPDLESVRRGAIIIVECEG